MPVGEDLSDDYVARLLAKDAKAASKYSSHGLQSSLPKRSDAPKPNTRFLKNIIRETDSHNAALRAKEAEESRARLRDSEYGNGSSSSRRNQGDRPRDSEHHRSKRRRTDDEDGREDGRVRSRGKSRSDMGGDGEVRRYAKRHSDRERPSHDGEDQSHRHHRHHRSHRRQGYSALRESSKHERRSEPSHQSGSRSPQAEGRVRHHYRSSRRKRSPSSEPQCKNHVNGRLEPDRPSITKAAASPGSDSDPLEAIIGPPPPPPAPKLRSRGRGAFTGQSGIDNHFSATYDPSLDAHPDPEVEDDWDQALEALRDRQKWQQQGAERLKSAGFTEDEVQKWLKAGPAGEKAEEDIRWKGRGEGREWDRGKVVTGDGVETGAEWGRLKGT